MELAGGERCSLDSGSVIAEVRRQIDAERVGADLFGEEGKKEMKEGKTEM